MNNCDTYAFVDSPPNTHMCMPNIDNSSFLDKNPYNMSDLKAGVTYTVVVWAFANNICSIPTCINATTGKTELELQSRGLWGKYLGVFGLEKKGVEGCEIGN